MIEKKPRLVIIEDDPEISVCYMEILNQNYSLQFFSSGIDAINLIKTTKDTDMVILDHNLPDLLGIEVLKRIKEIRPDIPILFVTAYGCEDLAVRSFRYGARDYLTKPFNFRELSEKVSFFLSLKNRSGDTIRKVLFHENKTVIDVPHNPIGHRNTYKIQKAIKFIEDNFMKKITLDTVAKHACMSRFYFSKIFKKEIGVSYQDYLNNQRIEKAKVIMTNNDCPITEVAFAVGYEDITHFGRMFKRKVGYTPSEYKNKDRPQKSF